MIMAIDPICGMTIDPARSAGKHEHNGQTYYFCSKHCLAKFNNDPAKFASGVVQGSAQNKSVADPVCGMKVDPAHAAGKHKHKDQTYYFCSQHCLAKFRKEPDKFLTARQHDEHGHPPDTALHAGQTHTQAHGT